MNNADKVQDGTSAFSSVSAFKYTQIEWKFLFCFVFVLNYLYLAF